jgi:hypothetical protein
VRPACPAARSSSTAHAGGAVERLVDARLLTSDADTSSSRTRRSSAPGLGSGRGWTTTSRASGPCDTSPSAPTAGTSSAGRTPSCTEGSAWSGPCSGATRAGRTSHPSSATSSTPEPPSVTPRWPRPDAAVGSSSGRWQPSRCSAARWGRSRWCRHGVPRTSATARSRGSRRRGAGGARAVPRAGRLRDRGARRRPGAEPAAVARGGARGRPVAAGGPGGPRGDPGAPGPDHHHPGGDRAHAPTPYLPTSRPPSVRMDASSSSVGRSAHPMACTSRSLEVWDLEGGAGSGPAGTRGCARPAALLRGRGAGGGPCVRPRREGRVGWADDEEISRRRGSTRGTPATAASPRSASSRSIVRRRRS